MAEAGTEAVIPPKSNRRFPAEFDRDTYKWRHLIENFFGKLKEYRGIATRCCKTDTSFTAFIAIVATIIQLTAERVVTRFEKGRPIRSWQPRRDGERNEALDTFVYAHAALHGLISMGMRLNDEAEGMGARAAMPQRVTPATIRSAWMG